MAWLDRHRPARPQFRRPRRENPSGVCVIHTAENTPDYVAFDGGAEAVANWIRTRTDAGSYHDLVDSDSRIQLVDWDCEAYGDGTGSNRHAWHGSVATRADVWPWAPMAWRAGAVSQLAIAAARYATWLQMRSGIIVPPMRITREQSERRIPGFISHAERDPARRRDPGPEFPWGDFLAEYRRLMRGTPPTPPQEDPMPTADEIALKTVQAIDRAAAVDHGKPGVLVAQLEARAEAGADAALGPVVGEIAAKVDTIETTVANIHAIVARLVEGES